MKPAEHNSDGVELGPRGYVVCTVCGKEVPEISRETVRKYAQCLRHQRDSQHHNQDKGDTTMPRVPKPSQAKQEQKERKAKKPKAAKGPKKARAKKDGAAAKPSHYAELTELAKAEGGLTPDEVRAECEKRGLSKKTGGNYVCYLKRDGLVKKEAKDKEAA